MDCSVICVKLCGKTFFFTFKKGMKCGLATCWYVYMCIDLYVMYNIISLRCMCLELFLLIKIVSFPVKTIYYYLPSFAFLCLSLISFLISIQPNNLVLSFLFSFVLLI